MVLSAQVEDDLNHTISHLLGLPVPPSFLLNKLRQVEDSRHTLEATVHTLQLRLLDLESRLTKSKNEATITAVALRKQIAENQKLEGQLKQVSERCNWLEEECSLYHNDREVFLVVAEEAEDRACKAEEQCIEMETKMAQLLTDSEQLKNIQKIEHTQWREELDRLGSKVSYLETTNLNLQAELAKSENKLSQLRVSQGASTSGADLSCGKEALLGSSQKNTSEPLVNKERPGTHQLMSEVQRLWREVALYKCNLARAEIQVRILDDDNKDLRLALRNRMSTASPHVSKKGKTSSTLFGSVAPKKDARQPLTPLETNTLNFR